MTNLNLGATLI